LRSVGRAGPALTPTPSSVRSGARDNARQPVDLEAPAVRHGWWILEEPELAPDWVCELSPGTARLDRQRTLAICG
jgi:hypothetical protein